MRLDWQELKTSTQENNGERPDEREGGGDGDLQIQ